MHFYYIQEMLKEFKCFSKIHTFLRQIQNQDEQESQRLVMKIKAIQSWIKSFRVKLQFPDHKKDNKSKNVTQK
jgi:hypothetical protein